MYLWWSKAYDDLSLALPQCDAPNWIICFAGCKYSAREWLIMVLRLTSSPSSHWLMMVLGMMIITIITSGWWRCLAQYGVKWPSAPLLPLVNLVMRGARAVPCNPLVPTVASFCILDQRSGFRMAPFRNIMEIPTMLQTLCGPLIFLPALNPVCLYCWSSQLVALMRA